MLHTIKPAQGSRFRRKRVARGNSAGGGTTAGRGTKGQQARAGKGRRWGFEGGQKPLVQRQPKLGGFNNPRRVEFEPINVGTLEELLEAGTYNPKTLKGKGLIKSNKPVKLLGDGKVSKKFSITVNAASKSAKAAVEKAGGSVTIIKN